MLAYKPALAVIDCGTNDIYFTSSTDLSPLFEMVAEAQAAGARVIVGTLPPNAYTLLCHPNPSQGVNNPATSAEQEALHAQWNSEIRAGAEVYGYTVADYYPAMLLENGAQNPALFLPDGVHPVAAGYAVMWDVLEPVLEGEHESGVARRRSGPAPLSVMRSGG